MATGLPLLIAQINNWVVTLHFAYHFGFVNRLAILKRTRPYERIPKGGLRVDERVENKSTYKWLNLGKA